MVLKKMLSFSLFLIVVVVLSIGVTLGVQNKFEPNFLQRLFESWFRIIPCGWPNIARIYCEDFFFFGLHLLFGSK